MGRDHLRSAVPLNPETLDAVSSLSIEVRKAVEGFLGGSHPSLHMGSSVEFSEHNKYCPGDDIRHIDWNAMARPDRYFVKAHEKEVVLACLMLLDTSPSMAYRGTRALYSKLDFARLLLGALGHIMVRQGDAAGIMGFAEVPGTCLLPERRPGHLSILMNKLAEMRCAKTGGTGFGRVLQQAAGKLGQRGMVVVASDLWGADARTEVVLSSLAARGHDVVLFHVLSPDELDLPFPESVGFRGMEGEGLIHLDPSLVREDYRREVEVQRERWREVTGRAGIDMVNAITDRTPSAVLSEFAGRRHRTRRHR